MLGSDIIGSYAYPSCVVCGADGDDLYEGLEDVLFGTIGTWKVKQCTNRNCGLVWLDPMPLADEIYKAYRTYPTHQDVSKKSGIFSKLFDHAQAGYRAFRFDFHPTEISLGDKVFGVIAGITPIRLHMDYPFSLLSDMHKGDLLELGCGSGETMKLLQDWGWKVEGIDFDRAAVSNASAKGLIVHLGDIFSCRYSPASFDVIFFNHVLEHVPDPVAVLAECYRILRPGGRCVFVTPNASSLGHRLFRSDWRGLEIPRHLHIFTPQSLIALASAAGFFKFTCRTSTRLAGPMFRSMLTYKRSRLILNSNFGVMLGMLFVHIASYVFNCFFKKSGEELIFVGYKQTEVASVVGSR